jgi:hypothetical protein
MYDHDYGDRVAKLRTWLDPLENFQQIGRNGLHRYNNSDHSSLTAIRTVDNIVNGTNHDIWAVNAESAYHEEDTPDEQPYKAAPETPVMQQEAAAADGDGATSPPPEPTEASGSLANASPSKEN